MTWRICSRYSASVLNRISPSCRSANSRRTDAERHIGVLGVGQDEVLRAGRIGVNGGDFLIEGFLRRQSSGTWKEAGKFEHQVLVMQRRIDAVESFHC